MPRWIFQNNDAESILTSPHLWLSAILLAAAPPARGAPSLVVDGFDVPLVGLCEPSGAALGRGRVAWVVDDDQDGVVYRWIPGTTATTALPLPAPPDGEVPKDAEGVAVSREGVIYVLGSHSLSKKGKLGRRGLLLSVATTPDDGVRSRTTEALREKKGTAGLAPLQAGLTAVCPDCVLPAGAAGDREGEAFDLEGLALLEDPAPPGLSGPPGLYVGARAPLLGTDALVFRLDPDRAMEPAPPADGAVPVDAAWRLPLGGRGVRALSPAVGGGLLVVAGPADKDDKAGVGAALYHWMPGALPALLGTLAVDPAVGWPEAVVSAGPREAWLLIDEGARLSGKDVTWHRDADGDFSCGAGSTPEAAWARARHISW